MTSHTKLDAHLRAITEAEAMVRHMIGELDDKPKRENIIQKRNRLNKNRPVRLP